MGDMEKVRDLIEEADAVCVLTGAGISAESGIPTFRGKDGLWRKKDPTRLASIDAFMANPEEVWEFYHWRRRLISKVTYNRGHSALVELERKKQDFTLITQNVDGLHSEAGSRNLIEIHGNIWWVRCIECGERYEERDLELPPLPRCGHCGGLLRPDVVFFGESLNRELLDRCYQALTSCEVMLVIGTSSNVQPAASFSLVAKEAGASLVEINLEPTPYSRYMDYNLFGKAGDILPMLVAENIKEDN